jgi:hypothetical protein
VVDDQLARENFSKASEKDLLKMMESDKARREKVLQLEEQGCLVTSQNYSDAALIFQHGTESSDYKRAFEWAKKANDKQMMAMTLDRYLVSLGHRQLFGTQANRPTGQECWCIEKFEKSFPDSVRTEYTGKLLSDQIKWVQSMNVDYKCSQIECTKKLSTPPKGLIPEW